MRSLVAVLVLVSVRAAFAGAEINLEANSPARVLFDGEEVGQTPTTIRDVAPGFHEVRVQSIATGEVRAYDLYAPRTAVVRKDIAIQFDGVPAEPLGDDAPPVDPEAQAQADAEAAEAAKLARSKEREKVRTRNTLLGVAAANELLNRGSSKKAMRGVSLGGALLNELIKR